MSDNAAVTPPPLSPQESRTFHINALIRTGEVDTNKISDGYHNFGELYDADCLHESFTALKEAKCWLGWELARIKKVKEGAGTQTGTPQVDLPL